MAQQGERTDTIYNFIRDFVEREGLPPTIREIAAGCKCGVSTVLYQVEILEANKLVARRRGIARGIRLVQRAEPSGN